MLKTIYCSKCGKSGSFPFKINWEYDNTSCDKCGHYKGKYFEYNFCSSKCMKEWVLIFVGHKHKWKNHPIIIGPYGKEGHERIMKKCEVCFIEKEFKATKRDIKELQKTLHEMMGDNNES